LQNNNIFNFLQHTLSESKQYLSLWLQEHQTKLQLQKAALIASEAICLFLQRNVDGCYLFSAPMLCKGYASIWK